MRKITLKKSSHPNTDALLWKTINSYRNLMVEYLITRWRWKIISLFIYHKHDGMKVDLTFEYCWKARVVLLLTWKSLGLFIGESLKTEEIIQWRKNKCWMKNKNTGSIFFSSQTFQGILQIHEILLINFSNFFFFKIKFVRILLNPFFFSLVQFIFVP